MKSARELFEELNFYITKMILMGFGLILFTFIYMCFPREKYHYEYIDLDNNKGIALNCSYKFKGYKRGGQGSPVCELDNGSIKQVKEYKYISDGQYIPIKEIIKGE